MALTPAIFLDKDGTVLEDVPFNVDPAKMVFAQGAHEGLARLATLGLPLIVITNQPGIALGKFGHDALDRMQERLRCMFEGAGAILHSFYFCPHAPQGQGQEGAGRCACRKPEPGLLLRAAEEHRIDLGRSWFVGDILDDVEAGRRAGCRTLLIDNGNETRWHMTVRRTPDKRVPDFHAASLFLMEQFPLDQEVRS